jgi:hypothetical protein
MRLLDYNDYKVDISPEAFALNAFKKLWNRDKTKQKDKAIQEFGYIYFMFDPRSSYQFYIEDETRHAEIVKDEGLDKKWKPDKDLLEAAELYKKLIQTHGALLLNKSRRAADKLTEELANIDFAKEDKNGKPIYTLNVVTSALKQMPDVVKSLIETEKMVEQEITEKSSMRGNKEKKIGEDGVLGFFQD